MNNIALIAPIESNIECLNKQRNIVRFPRLFEDEAIRCFESWRKNGGWLKDIPIYALCSTGNVISDGTKRRLCDLGVTYIEDYAEETEMYSSGFLTLPYCGWYFQDIHPIKEEITIRIDLDMILLRELNKKLFENIETTTIVGQYDSESAKDQRSLYENNLPFDTGFMITHRKNHFYEKWHSLCLSQTIKENSQWLKIRSIMGDYYLEEFVVDYMFANKIMDITPIQKYQHGEGYASVGGFTNEEMKSLYFRHEHIYRGNHFPWGYNSAKERMMYIKKIKEFDKI